MVSDRVTPRGQKIPIDMVGGSSFGRYSKINTSKTFNMFITSSGPTGIEGGEEKWLVNFPGYRRVLNLLDYPDPYPSNPPLYPDQVPVGRGRGIFHSIRGNLVIVVVNSVVYSLSPTLDKTTIGTLNTSDGEVFMAENLQSQICIVDGVNAWIYNYSLPAPNLVKQTNGALGSGALIPNYVEYHNTFFLFGNANTGPNGAGWYVYSYSTATGAAAITQTQQLTLQTKADFALAVSRLPGRGNNVLVLGSTVCEIWTAVPSSQLYQRNPSININYGCQSISTIAEGGDLLVWLGVNEDESPVIMYYDGNGATNISTDGIDYLMGTIKYPATSTATLFREDGHLFYMLTFYDPADNLTLMYDFNTKLFFNITNQDLDYHPARGMVYFNLKTYFISLRNAALYQLSSDITVIDENLPQTSSTTPHNSELVYDIQRMRITSNVRQETSARFVANSLVITLEQGTDVNYQNPDIAQDNLITESAFNPPDDDIITEDGQFIVDEDSNNGGGVGVIYAPRIDLRFSKTGGVTWSNYVSRTLNPLGHIQNILHWEGMGVANDICFCFRFWQTNRLIVNQAMLDIVP